MHCEVGLENLCLDNIDGHWWGVIVELVSLVCAFVGVAIVADAHLVVSLETLCVRWNVREDVAGASFMAFGSAAPEIIINAVSTVKAVISAQGTSGGDASGGGDDTALGVGAIIGSGMIAFTAIPGCCAVFAGQTLELKRRPLARDAGAYAVALAALYLALADGSVGLWQSGAMLLLYAAYMLTVICSSSIRQAYRVNVLGRARRVQESFVTSSTDSAAATPTQTASAMSVSTGVAATTATAVSLQPLAAVPVVPVPPTVFATPEGEGDFNSSLWDALPVQPSPMEFTSMDMSASLNTGGSASKRPTRARRPPWLASVQQALGRMQAVLFGPLAAVLRWTCPPCEHDGPYARLYPITLVVSFFWVALFSTIIAAVVSRFGDLLGVPASFLGMYVIAVGAEIPDMIQSVAVAKRGYGSMAVSNSTGSQIINILIGLGMPWFISNLAGREVRVSGVREIQVMTYLQAGNVFLFISLLLLTTMHTWKRGDHSKAQLGKRKGAVLLGAYAAALTVYAAVHLFVKGA